MSGTTVEDTEFRLAVGTVQPLGGEAALRLKRDRELTPGMLERRRAAEAPAAGEREFLSLTDITPVDPRAELSFLRPGVQYGVFRRLRLGEYRFEARLDLHGLGVAQAREALRVFIRDCMAHDVRAAMINHGRGAGRATPALLKSCVAAWLPQFPQVLAFHSAPRHLGGTGATVVLLAKSERSRQQNFEIHSKHHR